MAMYCVYIHERCSTLSVCNVYICTLLTREDGLDAVEDERERQQRGEPGDRLRHVLTLGEDVADVVPAQQDDGGDEDRQDEGEQRHYHHGERRRPWVAGAELVAHSYAGR
jgi:hypothetical protein